MFLRTGHSFAWQKSPLFQTSVKYKLGTGIKICQLLHTFQLQGMLVQSISSGDTANLVLTHFSKIRLRNFDIDIGPADL